MSAVDDEKVRFDDFFNMTKVVGAEMFVVEINVLLDYRFVLCATT